MRVIGGAAPYLFGLFFIMNLIAGSGGEMVRAGDLVVPMAITLLLAGSVHLGAWMLTHDGTKAALIAWGAVGGFGMFAELLDASRLVDAMGPVGGSAAGLLLVMLFFFGYARTIHRSKISLGGVLRYATVLSALVAVWNVVLAGRSLAGSDRPAGILPPSGIVAPAFRGRPPDVLLLVLDKYTGSRTLADQFGFDNGEFESFLRDRGFVVPKRARANYVQTFLALGAFLNVDYLDSLIASVGTESRSRVAIYHSIEANRLAAFFRERGYRFVFLPTAYGATRRNRFADIQLPEPSAIRSELATAWYAATPLPTIRLLTCAVVGCTQPMPYVPETAEMLDWKFEQLGRLAGGNTPLFVLAHFTLPHEPYLYEADCRHRAPYWPDRDDGAEASRVRRAYVGQIECLNRKLRELVTTWQTRAPVPPVILIQGDHGHGMYGRRIPAIDSLTADQVADRASVFAAYSLPGAGQVVIPDSVTPVNAMRLMLKAVYGANLPALEDATYWSSYPEPYRMRRLN